MPPEIDFVPDVQNDEGAPGAIDFQPDQAAALFGPSSLDLRPTFIPTLPPAETSPKLEAAKEMALALPQAFGIGLGAVEKGVGAAIGRIAGTGDTLEDVKRAIEEGEPLPVELSAAKARGIGGTLARVGLGLAETAPKIASLALFPGGILAQSIAAGGIFGLDAQGRFSPRAAAVGALLPGAGALAKGTVARALAGAMERGTIGTMHPATQWITEEMGHQAALNAVMLTADSPELIELYHTDRDAFRRKIEDTIGMNLAFGLFGGIKRLRGAPTATQEYVRKNAEKFGKIADNMITQQIVGGAGQQAIEKAIAEAKSRQKYAGFIKFPGDEDVAGSAQPMPPSGEEPPGFVPVAGPQLPPIEPKGPASAIQIGGLTAVPETSTVEDAAKSNLIQAGAPTQRGINREATADNASAVAKRNENAANAWLEAVAQNNSEARLYAETTLLGEPIPPQAGQRKGVLAGPDTTGKDVRASGGYGASAGEEIIPSGTSTSQEREQPGQPTRELGVNAIGGAYPQTPWAERTVVPTLRRLFEVQDPQEKARLAGILQGLLSVSSETRKKEIIGAIYATIRQRKSAPLPVGQEPEARPEVGGQVREPEQPTEARPPAEAAPPPVEPAKPVEPPKQPDVPQLSGLPEDIRQLFAGTPPPPKKKSIPIVIEIDGVQQPAYFEGYGTTATSLEPINPWISRLSDGGWTTGPIQPDAKIVWGKIPEAPKPAEEKPPEKAPEAEKPAAEPPAIDRSRTFTEQEAEDAGIASQLAREGWSFNLFDRKWNFKQTEPPKPTEPEEKSEETVAREPDQLQRFVGIVKLAADSPDKLRSSDVDRVMSEVSPEEVEAFRTWLLSKALPDDTIKEVVNWKPEQPTEAKPPTEFPQYPKPLTKEERKKNVFGAISKRIKAWEDSIKQWLTGRPENKAIIWEEKEFDVGKGPKKGNVKALTRNIGDPKNPWRVTNFWERNGAYMPSGHQVYPTREAALIEEARSVMKLHDSMPGRVMDEQEVQGYKLMKDVADPSTLVWYKFSGDPRILRERLRGTALMQDFVRDSQTADGKVAFTKPVTADLQDRAKIADRLKWLQLEEIAPEKPAEREIKIVYDDDYKGPRYRYGMRNRPLQIGAQPKGWIIGSDRPHPDFKNFGTIDYPFPLTKEELYSYELVDLGEVKPTLPPAAPPETIIPRAVEAPAGGGDAGKAAEMGTEPGVTPGPGAAEQFRPRKAITDDIGTLETKLSQNERKLERMGKLGVAGTAVTRLERTIEKQRAELEVLRSELQRRDVAMPRVSARAKGFTRFENETARGGEDILSWIRDTMTLMSRTAAKAKGEDYWRRNSGDWDGAIDLKLPPHHNAAVYGGGSSFAPAEVAQAAFDAGVLKEPYPQTLWDAIAKASKLRVRGKGAETREDRIIEQEEKWHVAWISATKKKTANKNIRVAPDNLSVGDVLEVSGEDVRVKSVDADGNIELDDGRKFGQQRLTDESPPFWVEKWEKAEGEDTFWPAAEPKAEPVVEAPAPKPPDVSAMSYDDLVKAAYAGQEARRQLNDLPDSLRNDATAFFDSGLPQDGKTIMKWLEDERGVTGSIGGLTSDIVRLQKVIQAVRLEAEATKELRRRENAPAKPSEKPVAPKPEVTPESIRKQLNRGYYNDAAGATWKVQQGDNGQFYVERTFNGDRQAGRESYDTIEEAQASAVEQIQGKPPIQPPPPEPIVTGKVLWGRLPGEPWVKLSDNVSKAEQARRTKDGWEVAVMPKGESPQGEAKPTPKPSTEPKLSDRERQRLSDLQMKDRANRDAIGRGELGDPLTPEEQREYDDLTIKAGQRTLFDVEEVVATEERPVLEGKLRNLEEKLAEMKRQQLLSLNNSQNRQMGGDKAKEFLNAAKTYEKRISETINEIADIKRKLRIGLTAEEEAKATPPEKPAEDDLFSQPAPKPKQKTREGAIEKAASYSGRSAEGWKEVRDTLNKPKGPEISPEQPSAPISAGKEGVSKGAGATAQPVKGLSDAESARLAELTAKVEANEPMTKAERERFVELQAKAGARSAEERPEVRSGEDEPPANLGEGLEPGQGMQSEAEVRQAIAGVDTAGFPVKVITRDQAAEMVGREEARGYGGFFWNGNVYLVRDNLSRAPEYREQVRQLMREEVGHGLLRTEPGRRLLAEIVDAGKLNLTDAEREALLSQGYREHQLLDEFIAKSARENLPWWKEMVERARVLLSRLGLAKLSNDEVSRMLLRQIRAQVRKQAELQRPSIRTQDDGLLRAPGLVEINPPIFPAIVAHHGTPHEVDRFRTDKIGTGEGAQVYGWGLYFAENPEVAKEYSRRLTDSEKRRTRGRVAAELLAKEQGRANTVEWEGSVLSFYEFAQRFRDGEINDNTLPPHIIEKLPPKEGNNYKVAIDVNPDELLDWDKPLSEQSEKVRNAFVQLGFDPDSHRGWGYNGEETYHYLANYRDQENMPHAARKQAGPAEASKLLQSLGIPGIRYLDQGSRNAPTKVLRFSGKNEWAVVEASGDERILKRGFGSKEEAQAFADSQRTYNYVIFDDSIIKITEQNGKPVKASDLLPEGPAPSRAVRGGPPEQPTPEGERPGGPKMGITKVAGEEIGIERPMEFIAGIRQRLRTGYFDGSQPVETGRTENAWQIAQMMVNPETKGAFASELQRSGGGEMAPGLLRNELWDYAVRQAVRGDTSLMEFMVRRSQDFQTLAGEALANGDTALGRGLRAARDRAFGGMWSRLTAFRTEQLAATGRRLQQGEAGLQQIIEAIDGLVASIGDIDAFERELRTPELQRVLDSTSETRQAADAIVSGETFIPPERRSTILETVYQWMSREVDPQADRTPFTDTLKAELQRLRLTPEQAQTIADATWNRKLTVDGAIRRRLWDQELRRLDNLAEKTADAFILSVDQAEWKRPEQVNEVRDIIKEALKSEAPLDSNNVLGFKRDLTQRLLTAGLSEGKARDLANAITKRRETDLLNAQLRVRDRAVQSKSLKSLVESIKSSPYLAQQDPEWRFDTAVRWFESNGLSREQAQEAAKMFDAQFVSALTRAAEQAAKRLILKGDYGRNVPELVEAVRLGLTDPSKEWTEEIAKREGFRPLTPEAQQRLATLEEKYSNPNLSAHEQVALVEQMMGIVRHAGDPKGRVMKIMGESFAASLLSGIRTITLNWLQPWFTMVTTGAAHGVFEPRDFGTVVRSMWNASKNWWPEYKYAWSKDAYELSSEEQVFHSNALKTAFEDAQKDWSKGNYAKAVLEFSYGWQQYVIRGLQAADQAGMATAREWKMALYGSIAMREAGLRTSQISELVDVAAGFKRAEYERALYNGKTPNEAQVIANEATIDAMTNFFENKLGSRKKAEAVEEAALYDAFNIVGRRAPHIDETAEGFLSRYSGLNRVMRFVSETRREGGGASILTIMAVGFMNVPMRTARFYAGFSPYGILRYGIDKYRTNRGQDPHWKQSYANEYQAKARLREALVGTSLMLAFLGWQHNHHTSDDDAEKKAFAMYVTGSGPSNKTMRDAWIKRGFEPYTLHIVANGAVRSKLPVNRVGQILAFPLGLAASLDDLAWRRKQEQAISPGKKEFAGREIVAAMGTYYNIVGAQGVLQAFSHLSQIGQGQSGTGRAVGVSLASTGSALAIPGKSLIQGVTDMMFGAVDRSSVEAAMMANVPVLNALWNGQAINRFGDQIGDRTWSARLSKLGVPILLRVSDTAENKALYQMLLDKGAAPPDLRRYIVEEKYGPLSQDEWQKFVKLSGSKLKSDVLANLASLNSTDPHGVKLFLNRAAQIANDYAAQSLHLTQKPTFSTAASTGGGSAVPALPKGNIGLPTTPRISLPGASLGGKSTRLSSMGGYGSPTGSGTTGFRRARTGRLSLSGLTGGQQRFVRGRLRARSTRLSRFRRGPRISTRRRSFRRRRISLRV